MKHWMLLLIGLSAAMFVLPETARANFYFYPQAGATIPLNEGDPSYSLGLTGGYHWNRYFSTQLTYEHLFATGNASDGNQVKAEGVARYTTEFVTPYVNAGVGYLHVSRSGLDDIHEPIGLIGGGVFFGPFGFFSVGLGATYTMVPNFPDYIQPVATVGVAF